MQTPEVNWLYSASGVPVAFLYEGYVFLCDGDLLGKRVGNEIWNVHYVGEIFAGDRLVRKLYRPLGSMEELAGWASPPMSKAPPRQPEVVLPSEFHELETDLNLIPPASFYTA